MKKIIYVLAIACTLFFSCNRDSSSNSEDDGVNTTESEEMEKLEKTAEDLESETENVSSDDSK